MGMDTLPRPVVWGKGVWIRNFEWTGADPQAMRHYDDCGLCCLGILQVTGENKTFLGAAELSFFKAREGKLCSIFLLCSVFLCASGLSHFIILHVGIEASKFKSLFKCLTPIK